MNLRSALKSLIPGRAETGGSGADVGGAPSSRGGSSAAAADDGGHQRLLVLAGQNKLLVEEVAALAGRLGDHGREVERALGEIAATATGEEGGSMAVADGSTVSAPGLMGRGELAEGRQEEEKGDQAIEINAAEEGDNEEGKEGEELGDDKSAPTEKASRGLEREEEKWRAAKIKGGIGVWQDDEEGWTNAE
eukprot:CAMPEP_0172538838 /NCGR_PEP_ID=MMETSP1067-20121228/10154_1 /TAXON_ID=265564 ORGANISM="Thalassiosira punctigera, Strain Tpunct2005C2" /NCGR_SAMPLE_ID=MMETSP1067 /ASSEMBLY_ACC=CAM_ASM_000444 /LENGTH=191 /DNA_ID=CAMNT_0013324421 /DNA_START=72 /DNA_END=644 /DNA_ORIENTATION=-